MKTYDPSKYRVIFFSSAPIGIPFFEEIAQDKRFEIVGVVTQPDKPVGRGLQIQENIVKTTAKAYFQTNESDLTQDIQTPTSINPEKSEEGKAFYERLQSKQADMFIVIAYGKILPQKILEMPKFWAINVHGSLLPKYRGASPLQSVFLHKETKSWLTIMKMDAGMDTWEIIDQLSFPLQFHWTVKELIEAFCKVWPKFLNDTLRKFAKGEMTPEKQDENQVILTKKIEKADGAFEIAIDPLEEIYAKYRAFFLRPKLWCTQQGKRVVIEKLILDEKLFETHKKEPLITGKTLNPAVKEIALKPEGKKAMDRASFANGYVK